MAVKYKFPAVYDDRTGLDCSRSDRHQPRLSHHGERRVTPRRADRLSSPKGMARLLPVAVRCVLWTLLAVSLIQGVVVDLGGEGVPYAGALGRLLKDSVKDAEGVATLHQLFQHPQVNHLSYLVQKPLSPADQDQILYLVGHDPTYDASIFAPLSVLFHKRFAQAFFGENPLREYTGNLLALNNDNQANPFGQPNCYPVDKLIIKFAVERHWLQMESLWLLGCYLFSYPQDTFLMDLLSQHQLWTPAVLGRFLLDGKERRFMVLSRLLGEGPLTAERDQSLDMLVMAYDQLDENLSVQCDKLVKSYRAGLLPYGRDLAEQLPRAAERLNGQDLLSLWESRFSETIPVPGVVNAALSNFVSQMLLQCQLPKGPARIARVAAALLARHDLLATVPRYLTMELSEELLAYLDEDSDVEEADKDDSDQEDAHHHLQQAIRALPVPLLPIVQRDFAARFGYWCYHGPFRLPENSRRDEPFNNDPSWTGRIILSPRAINWWTRIGGVMIPYFVNTALTSYILANVVSFFQNFFPLLAILLFCGGQISLDKLDDGNFSSWEDFASAMACRFAPPRDRKRIRLVIMGSARKFGLQPYFAPREVFARISAAAADGGASLDPRDRHHLP